MRIVARLKNLEEMNKLINLGVDVFLVDTPLAVKRISLDIHKDISEIKRHGKVYLLMNKMIHEIDLPFLGKWLKIAKEQNVDGIVCGDLTVMVKAEEIGVLDKIIYQPGTMNTNSFDNEYFSRKHLKGITISKEITLTEILNIAKDKKTELSLVGHGFIDMFYSKRKLITNYFKFKEEEKIDILDNYNFRLTEEKRPDSLYPILEDNGGTHIFRDKALESFAEVKELRPYLDDFFIERIFLYDDEYYDSILSYKDEEKAKDFIAKYQVKYDKGFYYLYTEKLKGEER